MRIHVCTWTTNEDPPFCTHISPRIHPFAHVTSKSLKFDWLLPAEAVPIKGCLFGDWPYITRCFDVCNIILSLFLNPTKMPKAARKSSGEEGDDIPLHSTINEEEAKEYSKSLDSIVIKMGVDVKEELRDVMKRAILDYKEVIM